MFTTRNQKDEGFFVAFANGWTASVQWAECNYCTRHHREGTPKQSNTAEVAAWHGEKQDRKWHKFADGQEVAGWCSPEFVAKFLARVAAKPAQEE